MTAFLPVAVLRDYMGDQHIDHEPVLTSALDAACGALESSGGCNRQFSKGTEPVARRYFVTSTTTVRIHDTYDVDTVKVDTSDNGTFDLTWAAADYELEPADGVGPNGVPGWPFTSIRAIGTRTFPCGGRRRRVEVMGSPGWPAVPEEIEMAALQLAHRLFDMSSASLGVVAADDVVGAIRVSRQIAGWADLIAPYVAYGGRGLLVG